METPPRGKKVRFDENVLTTPASDQRSSHSTNHRRARPSPKTPWSRSPKTNAHVSRGCTRQR
eukprot:2912190-Ditylum_brightwellii.AAC.1